MQTSYTNKDNYHNKDSEISVLKAISQRKVRSKTDKG